MIQSYRNISLNTAVKLFNCQELSNISIILGDSSYINLEKDDQLIKYHFDSKNIVRIINPDLISIYNEIIKIIKKNYKSSKFHLDYYLNRLSIINLVNKNINYPLKLLTRIIDDIYIYNTELKKKRKNVSINYIIINILPNFRLYFYFKKKIYHIENIVIYKSKITDKKFTLIYPELIEQKYQVNIYDFINYPKELLNKKDFYYEKNNQPLEKSLRKLETYLWIKKMIFSVMMGDYNLLDTSSDTSTSSSEIDLSSDEDA